MVIPSPVVMPLINPGSEVIIMEYDFCAQSLGTQNQLDPFGLSLKAANNLPIPVEGVTCVKIQIDDQVVKQVEVVVT